MRQLKPAERENVWQLIGQDGVLLTGLVMTVMLVVLNWALTGFYWLSLPPEVPLFYSLPIGEEQLVVKWWIWVLPMVPTVSMFTWLILYRLSQNVYLIYHQLSLWLVGLVGLLSLIGLIHVAVLVL